MLPLIPILEIGSKIFDKLFPDPEKKAAAELELYKLQQSGVFKEIEIAAQQTMAQVAVNAEEAKSASVFVSGWRPFVGWIGGLGLAYVAILEPIARFVATVYFKYDGAFPVIDTTVSLQVLLGMLGLGGMRSLEKIKGVAAK